MSYSKEKYPLQDHTRTIIGIGIEIHKTLGFGFLEIEYKDAFEHEFRQRDIFYEREKRYDVPYKNVVLPHKFYADFVAFGEVILEIKAKEGIAPEDMAQTLNYLNPHISQYIIVSKCNYMIIFNLINTI